ncbi:MAG: PTS sugar transporter subunit IIA, partial [Gemmatimonadota bacterium]
MKLSEYADARLVVTDVAEGEVGEILAQLIAPLASGGFVDDTADVLAALISREEVLSTGIGLGIAVPHAISGSLTDPHLVIGLSEGGVDFKSI